MFERRIEVVSTAHPVDPVTREIVLHQESSGSEAVVVWDAALVLSYFIQKQQNVFNFNKKNRVVELGAGTGIVGLVASVLGADVILTDLKEHIPLLEKNIEANLSNCQGDIKAKELRWGNVEDLHELRLKENKLDFVLISDCVYYSESVGPLVETLKALCDSETQVLLSYEVRNSPQKLEVQNQFFERINKENFDIHHYATSDCHPDYAADDIKVIKLKKLLD